MGKRRLLEAKNTLYKADMLSLELIYSRIPIYKTTQLNDTPICPTMAKQISKEVMKEKTSEEQ